MKQLTNGIMLIFSGMFARIFKFGFIVLLGCLISGLLLLELSGIQKLGILLSLLLCFILALNPFIFLFSLFFIRASLDNIFVSYRFTIAGIDVGLGGLFALALSLGVISTWLVQKRKISLSPFVVLYLIFIFASFITFIISPDMNLVVKELNRRMSVLFIILLVSITIACRRDVMLLLRAIIISSIIPIILGAIEFLHNFSRVKAAFSHPNIFAFYLLLIMGATVFQIDNSRNLNQLTVKRFLFIVVLSAMLLLTQTRSAWLACIFILFIYGSIFNRKMIIPTVVLVAIIASSPIANKRIGDLFTSTASSYAVSESSSLAWRIEKWSYVLTAIKQKPFIGRGLGAAWQSGPDYSEAHNDYLRVLVESGIIGFISYFILYIYLLKVAMNKYRKTNDILVKKMSAFFLCMIPAILIMSFSENLISYLTVQWYFWGIASIFISYDKLLKQKIK